MMSNLLNSALSVIPRTSFQVEKYSGESTNEIGYVVSTFDDAETVLGIVQAVENAAYQKLGLDMGKNYVQAWAEYEMNGIDRQRVADRIIYNSRTFNVIKSTDWMVYNGWSSVVAVEDKSA